VGGGEFNSAGNSNAVVSGGYGNTATGTSSTIAGGEVNQAQGLGATIGGGFYNTNTAQVATIAGGDHNTASNLGSSIGGGFYNTTAGYAATVAGGERNTASGAHAAIPGGISNVASGTGSLAAGVRAKATNDYSFVWGGSPDVDTTSTTNGQFVVRSPGGAKFLTSTNDSFGVQLSANGAGWSSISDSNAKTAVSVIDHRQTLAKLASLPVTEWRYKHDPSRRYIGPMAQDFHAAFALGSDNKTISTLDTDGVALSAIKGLAEELRAQDEKLEAREAQIQALEQQVELLQTQVGL
jgi:hypothetical protein